MRAGKNLVRAAVLAASCLVLWGCRSAGRTSTPPTPSPTPGATPTEKVTVASLAFADGALIPAKYTCDGENISPPISWGTGPAGTQSWAIVVEDPDAPGGMWSHWVLFNLPASTHELTEHQAGTVTLANGAVQGFSDFKQLGYGGPCPPSGTHRYIFRIYAVNTNLPLGAVASRQELIAALRGHVLAEGSLIGKYSR